MEEVNHAVYFTIFSQGMEEVNCAVFFLHIFSVNGGSDEFD